MISLNSKAELCIFEMLARDVCSIIGVGIVGANFYITDHIGQSLNSHPVCLVHGNDTLYQSWEK